MRTRKCSFFLLLFLNSHLFAQSCGVIYVTPTGASSGAAGTQANPASLTYALTLATGSYNRIWLAAGTYTIAQPLQLVSNTTIEGGFDATTWIKSNATPSVIHKDNSNVIPVANALVGLAGNATSNFRLQDLTIQVDAANTPQTSVYGIYLNGCSNYNIVRCSVTTGAGGSGTNGTAGMPGTVGGNGVAGVVGNTAETYNPGGAGGVGGGVNNNGGNGGQNGRWNGSAPAGSAGLSAGCGGGGGSSGSGPNCPFLSSCNSCGGVTAGVSGQNGQAGTAGTNGTGGPTGTVVGGYFVPGVAGGNGGGGTDGCGGGGGGGGGGRQRDGDDWVGGAGGGGGGGGGGGTGGSGGTGGGGSFAVFLFNNGAGGNVIDCSLIPGGGGAGGAGGAGGTGGAGGSGGAGGASGHPCAAGVGGNGGNGGAGGNGGTGGSGATGLSQALSENGGTPVSQANITSVPGNPPIISVQNYGCTNSMIAFTSPASGAWTFGSGANPTTGNGTNSVTTYSSVGRKTISFSGTTFTDFVDIFTTSVGGSITHTANPTVVGCPDTFSTPVPGSSYTWIFGAAQPPTVTSATATVPTSFLSVGAHTVYVQITTACCGIVTDSLVVFVEPNTINVTLAASTNTVCVGDPITYTATPSGYLGYGFLINGNIEQQGPSNTFTTNALVQGDSVMVVAFDGVCYSNPSSVHHPTVLSIPSAILASSDADNTICSGESVTFTASPSGYASYTFYNNGTQAQSSSSETYTTTALATGNSITVAISESGCTGAASTPIVTVVNPTPAIALATVPSNTICEGDNATITVTPNGLDNYDFSVNSSSVQNTASNSYSSASFNNGDVVSVIASENGCFSQPQTVTFTVSPIPTATLTSSDADNFICQNESITFTANPTGYTTYVFYNNGTQIQSSASNTYTTSSLAAGNSITVVAINSGCPSPASNAIATIINPAPAVDAGANQATCLNSAPLSLNGTPTGGVWTGQGVSSSGTFTPSNVGTFNLLYAYTDATSGCTGYDSLQLTVNSLPITTVSDPVSTCEGGSATLFASGGVSYSWSPTADLQNANTATPIASPSTSSVYTVTVTDGNGCTNTAIVTVTVNPNPVASFSAQPACSGQPMTFVNASTPTSGITYVWAFGDGGSSSETSPSHTYAEQGSYSASLIVQLGNCYDMAAQTVTSVQGVTADFSANPTTTYDKNSTVQFTDQSQFADSWSWNFGDGGEAVVASPSHAYTQEGLYSVTLIASNQYGCEDTVTKTNYIRVFPTPSLYIPNAFTPNGDNNNDVLKVYANGVKFMEWEIFNRWGEKVYQSNDIDEGWDGKYKGNFVNPGMYVYSLNIVYRDATSSKIKGSITVIR